jgi:hypothetical protein
MAQPANGCAYAAESSIDFLDPLGMKKAKHSPHSPDSALSDFFMFRETKGVSSDFSLHITEDFLSRIDKILSSAEQTVSTAVFQTWMRRFEFCREKERKDFP